VIEAEFVARSGCTRAATLQDRDAIKAWVDGNADCDKARDVCDSLAHLKVGEGWIWAPDHSLLKRVKFPAITTLDTSKTPKASDARITAPVLAATDIAKLKAAFARILSERTIAKAPTPKRAKSASQPLPKRAPRHPTARQPDTSNNSILWRFAPLGGFDGPGCQTGWRGGRAVSLVSGGYDVRCRHAEGAVCRLSQASRVKL
jgi:hypothetical protein